MENPSLSKVLLQPVEGETHQVLCQSSSLLFEDDKSPHVSKHQQTEDDGEVLAWLEKEGSNRRGEEMEEISLGSNKSPQERTFSNLLRKFCPTKRHSQALEGTNSAAEQLKMDQTDFMTLSTSLSNNLSVSGPLARDVSTCTPQSWTRCPAHPISPSTDSSESSVKHYQQPQSISPFQATSPTCSIASLSSDSTNMTDRSETSTVQRPQLKLSLPCQALLLQSKLLQPYVSLTRLSSQQRSSEPVGQGSSDDQVRGNVEEEPACSFDPNTLYSSYSSSSGGEDSLFSDPDYKPHIKKKKLLLEYEAARTYI